MAMLTVRIDDELNDRIAALASRSGRTKTFFIKRLIVDAIQDLEDEIWAQEVVADHLAARAAGESAETIELRDFLKELDRLEMETKVAKKRAQKLEQDAKKRSGSNTAGTRKARDNGRSKTAGKAA